MFLTLRRSMRGPIALYFSGRRSCQTFGRLDDVIVDGDDAGNLRRHGDQATCGHSTAVALAPGGQDVVGGGDRGDEGERVVDDGFCVVGGDAGDGVARHHDLVARG